MSFVLTRDIVSSWTAAEVFAWLCVELGVDAEQLAIRESDRVDGKVCLFCLRLNCRLTFASCVFDLDIGKCACVCVLNSRCCFVFKQNKNRSR